MGRSLSVELQPEGIAELDELFTPVARSPLLRQGAWALVDQILSSATNFAMAIIVARLLEPEGYGQFALATATWLTLLGLVRAMVVQPYVVEAAVQDRPTWRRTTRQASGVIVVFGLVSGLVIAAVGVALGASGGVGRAFVMLGVIAPFLVLQDFWRFAAFSKNRARTAVVNDALWAVVQGGCLLVLLDSSRVTPAAAIAAWGAGAGAGALLGMAQFNLIPSFRRPTLEWARHIARWSGWFGAASLLYMGSNQLVAIMVATWAGPAALGGLRAVQTLLGPGQLVAMSSESVALPAGSRTYAARGRNGLTRFMAGYGALLTAVLASYGALLFIGRDEVLRRVLGSEFVAYADLVLPLALGLIATAWSFSGALGLRSMLSGRRLAQGEGIAACTQVAIIGVLLHFYGVEGAAWGVLFASLLHSAAMWLMYRRTAVRRRRPASTPAAPVEPAPAVQPGSGGLVGPDFRFPDFYLVGAPKCGTTTLYDTLRQHPQLQMPATKELLYFGSDLSFGNRPSAEEYLAQFAGLDRVGRVGTAHTAYLQSRRAPEEIHAVRPDARIIVMLRNPVEMLPSWHSELLYEAIEDLPDFEDALAAEPDRRRGFRLPKHAGNGYVEALYYRDVADFSAQVARYFDVFGREQVHVVLFDDLRTDPGGVARAVFEFLDVDPDFVPELTVSNANKALRSRKLQELFFHTEGSVRRAGRIVLPRSVRRRLVEMNTRTTPRAELSPEVRTRLEEEFRGEVARLSRLLDRDLGRWHATASTAQE